MASQILTHNVWTMAFEDVTDQAWNFGYDEDPTSYLVHYVATGGDAPTTTQDYTETGTVGAATWYEEPYPKKEESPYPANISAHFKDDAAHDIYIKPLQASGKITY